MEIMSLLLSGLALCVAVVAAFFAMRSANASSELLELARRAEPVRTPTPVAAAD